MSRMCTSSPPSAPMVCSGTALLLFHWTQLICWVGLLGDGSRDGFQNVCMCKLIGEVIYPKVRISPVTKYSVGLLMVGVS
jgi:hypothetical protein